MSTLPGPFENGPEFQFTTIPGNIRPEIVTLAGNRNVAGSAFIPADQFDLTALGADVDFDGHWNSKNYGLNEWKHIATAGRDQYVRIVLKGYLFPLGHRAVLVEIAERIFDSDPANPGEWSDAIVQVKYFVKVMQPVVNYPAYGQPFDGNSWPFTKVEMKTLVTPPLDPLDTLPIVSPVVGSQAHSQVMWLTSFANPVSWVWVATDAGGSPVHLTSQLAFMFGEDDTNYFTDEFDPAAAGSSATAASHYNSAAESYRTATTNGEHIQFAPPGPSPAPQGSTSHPTYSIELLASIPTNDPTTTTTPSSPPTEPQLYSAVQPAFYPAIGSARVKLPAAEGLSRGDFNDSSGPGVSIEYYGPWVAQSTHASPYASNPGSVYLQLTDNTKPAGPPTLKFPGDAVGGIGTPNVGVGGLSAVAGLVSGPLDHYAQNGFQDPSAYFPGLTGVNSPQLLGGLHLGDILGSFLDANGLPTIVNDPDPTTGVRTITYTMHAQTTDWPSQANPVFQTFGTDPSNPVADAPGEMHLTAVITITPTGQSTYNVKGEITPFVINILGTGGGLNFLLIPFNKCTFTSKSGSKPDIKVEIGQVQFQGALSFVNTLEQFLEDLGGSGFKVSVTPTEVKAGFSISLPDISIGMVDLSNLGMSASVEIPFLGAPALATFSFASKEKHFLVTVSMFGGGGFITLVLGLQAVQQVSACIEFAGNFSLDLYIASGGITLTAGIYYNYDANSGVTLTGYVKLVGELEVLGIISITVTLDLELTYHEQNGASYVAGTATLSASIHIIFFTITIPITIHKQFTGSSSNTQNPSLARMRAAAAGKAHDIPEPPPALAAPSTFEDLIPDQPTWQTYCSAFAA